VVDNSWRSPSRPWNVKIARAREHIETLGAAVASYAEQDPYEITYEQTESPYERRVRRVERLRAPERIGAVVGDVVHNLRSALDSVAYELARRDYGGEWGRIQKRAPQFPICRTGDEFLKFFSGPRGALYTPQSLKAMRAVQSFWGSEQYPEAQLDPDTEFRVSTLRRLNDLSNLDKHRRIPLIGWVPDTFWWSSTGATRRSVQRPRPGDADDVLAYVIDVPGQDEVDQDVVWEFTLALNDDPPPGGTWRSRCGTG
jgi:hypothetical protein